MKRQYIDASLDTPAGKVPRVGTRLKFADRLGGFQARATINRMHYTVEPGVYAVGNPDADSIVLVSSNYKLSFDVLRKALDGLDAWIIVLDTKGINVWCAAGKGTFGTKELVNRIESTELKKIVSHRKLIVPQLGAVGVAAHEVKKLSGFSVLYGPVRAEDLKTFLKNGMKTTLQMRQVHFNICDRLVLVPAEIAAGRKYLFPALIVFFLLSGLNRGGYSIDLAASKGISSMINLILAYLAGTMLGPVFLPWLPGRSFSTKGFFAGLCLLVFSLVLGFTGNNSVEMLAWMLLIPAIASFATMNFTGASTYTSLSGVVKEMKIAVPLQFIAAVIGSGFWLAARFV